MMNLQELATLAALARWADVRAAKSVSLEQPPAFVLTEPEPPRAVLEQRRASEQSEPARIYLGQVGDDRCLRARSHSQQIHEPGQ
jgi:hypothetical protein